MVKQENHLNSTSRFEKHLGAFVELCVFVFKLFFQTLSIPKAENLDSVALQRVLPNKLRVAILTSRITQAPRMIRVTRDSRKEGRPDHGIFGTSIRMQVEMCL